MAVPTSTRDLSRAVAAYIQAPVLPLPEELFRIIEGYLEKHAKYDESSAERLNDELLSIYTTHVQEHPERFAPFLAVLRQLREAIREPDRIFEWWDKLAEPVLVLLGRERGLAQEAITSILDLLTYQPSGGKESDSPKNPFAVRLLDRWFQLSRPRCDGKDPDVAAVREKIIEETLFQFGRRQPKSFLASLDTSFLKKEQRAKSLALLVQFLQSQPPHLHLILQTPLFGSLLTCLLYDTSTATISLALTALVMLLPNMPGSLVPYLSSLFNIYARLLFWDKECSVSSSQPEHEQDVELRSRSGGWEQCVYSPELDIRSVPQLPSYFTVLYGLFPINFMDYIRKPQRYLRHANDMADIEVQPTEIRDRSEPFRQQHLLHPNFYSLTIESEKTDFSRWMKSEPAEVVADCLALCLSSDGSTGTSDGTGEDRASRQIFRESSTQDDRDSILASSFAESHTPSSHSPQLRRSGSSAMASATLRVHTPHRDSQPLYASLEVKAIAPGADSPTLPPHLASVSSPTQLQDMINSNRVIKSGLNQSLANDSVPSLSLSHPESIPEKVSTPDAASGHLLHSPSPLHESAEVALLQRKIMLLQNDLNFERYMKQQHIAHIAGLRAKQMREAATEAETQNLIMTNRTLKHRLEEAKRSELQTKKEAESRRAMAKKWEADLSAKLRTLREEQKKWKIEGAALQRDMEAAKEECKKLRALVAEAEDRELKATQHEQSIKLNADETERLRAEIARLSASERTYQGKEMEMAEAIQASEEADRRAATLLIELRSRERELTQVRSAYESQIVSLNTKLSEAQRSSRASVNMEANPMVQSALAASRAKQADLQKQYSQLMRKYTALQSSLLEMSCSTSPPRGRQLLNEAASLDGEADVAGLASSPVSIIKTRPNRGLSDPESFETGAYNVTAPLEMLSTSVGRLPPRPSTPSSLGEGSGPGQTSPQQERYFGRGGVQNTIRKERKDKKPDAERKDKKPPGIRGIRGFN